MNCNPTFTAARNHVNTQVQRKSPSTNSTSLGIPTNVKVGQEAYVIQLALPGFQSSDLDIQMEGTTLSVTAKAAEITVKPNVRREFSTTERKRQFTLPKDVDQEQITAKFEQGILEVRLPKSQKQTVQTIQIQ